MRLISMLCPHCGAKLSIDMDRQQAFCQYCGNTLLIDDDHTVNINSRIVDEARLKEAEVRLKELEYAHEMSTTYAREEKTYRMLILVLIAALAIGYLTAGPGGFAYVLIFGGLALCFLKPKHRYAVQQDVYVPGKSRGVALLLCFFFGVFGAHYFYVGRPGMGLLYLFTFGFGGLGWLVDMIRILIGTFRDSSGRLLN